VPDRKQNLPQLYRFCYLMMGDARKAQDIFHATLREVALLSSNGEIPNDPLWLYREARSRCLEASERGLQAEEDVELDQADLSPVAPAQITKLDADRLAIWISAAPEPQRTALALFYLDQFDHEEILSLTGLKLADLSRLLAQGRRQFQAWLNAILAEQQPAV
jgi:DNA-directed RNA polymerase specialized sigma24 family protein